MLPKLICGMFKDQRLVLPIGGAFYATHKQAEFIATFIAEALDSKLSQLNDSCYFAYDYAYKHNIK